MNIIHNRHDSFFRKILSDNEIATDYLKSYLPSNISEKLDFSTLTEVSHTYVSKELRQRFADIVFTCKLRNETDGEVRANVQISILIEHKSYVDKFAPFQIGSYLFSGYLKQIKNSEDLMPIIPILFYHGREKWEHKSIPDLFDNLGHDFLQFIPNFEYLNHSLWDLSDKQIEDLSNHFLTASLLTLKHCMEHDWLERNALKIFTRLTEKEGKLPEELIIYFFSNSKTENVKFTEIIKSLPANLKDKIMSTLDMLIEKGKNDGIAQEREHFTKKLLAENKFTDSEIARLANVSIQFVELVKGKHQ